MIEAPASAGIVLAGGKSTRLGRDKASEVLLGQTLLQRVIDRLAGLVGEIVVVKARGQVLPAFETGEPVRVVDDLFPEVGPLGGIYTGLVATPAPYAIVVACDMPLLQRPLVAEVLRLAPGSDVVIPVTDEHPQTLCAVYGKACMGPARAQLEAGRYKITAFFDAVRVRYLQQDEWCPFDRDGISFQNLNREEDLSRARSLLEQGR